MEKRVVEVLQSDMVRAFKRTGLPLTKFAGFEDGFRLGVQHHAEQKLSEACGHAIIPDVEVRYV
jgi:hypothetical protein